MRARERAKQEAIPEVEEAIVCATIPQIEENIEDFSWKPGETFGGHVWVERDGVIIDPYFTCMYTTIALINKCKIGQESLVYLPASEEIQTKWLSELLMHCEIKDTKIN